MFGKKKCSRCNKKIDKNFDFCPFCANPIKNKNEYGLLGKSDDVNELNNMLGNRLMGGLGNSIMDGVFKSAMKIVEKEMQNLHREEMNLNKIQKSPNLKTNFELFVNGKKVNLPGNIAGVQIEEMPGTTKSGAIKSPKQKMPKISNEILEKSAKLPRKEAKSRVSRTAEKVIYELETPNLSSLNNVLVNQLENSIEIKAYTDKVVYFKNIPIKLPLMQYSIKQDGKLILEFKA